MALTLDTVERSLNSIRPMIQSHGGDIELVKIEDGTVYIRFKGACVSCPISVYTLRFGVEEQLKQDIPDIKNVVAVE